jgi:hypothetical protein
MRLGGKPRHPLPRGQTALVANGYRNETEQYSRWTFSMINEFVMYDYPTVN